MTLKHDFCTAYFGLTLSARFATGVAGFDVTGLMVEHVVAALALGSINVLWELISSLLFLSSAFPPSRRLNSDRKISPRDPF